MKTLTYNDLLSTKPYFPLGLIFGVDWTGTVLDILNMSSMSAKDRFWLVLHDSFIDDKVMRSFSIWNSEQIAPLMLDARSLSAISSAKGYVAGSISIDQLTQSWTDAKAAAWDASKKASAAGGSDNTLNADWDVARAAAWCADPDSNGGTIYSTSVIACLQAIKRLGIYPNYNEEIAMSYLKQLLSGASDSINKNTVEYQTLKFNLGNEIVDKSIPMIALKNEVLNKTPAEIQALMVDFSQAKSLLEVGGLATARIIIQGIAPSYPDYQDTFDYILFQISQFEATYGVLT